MAAARREGIDLTEVQWMSLLLTSSHQVVVEAFKRKGNFLTEEQHVGQGHCPCGCGVRLAQIKRRKVADPKRSQRH